MRQQTTAAVLFVAALPLAALPLAALPLAALSLAALSLAALPLAAQESDRLTLGKMLDWERVAGPRISPDGKTIVFTRSWTDKVNDNMRSELWIMDVDGKNQRFLMKGSSPRWSPDGTRIAYLRKGEPSGNQIHVLHMMDRSSTQITHLSQSPSGIRWSPDDKSIAFSMQVPEKNEFKIKLPKRPKGAKWAEEPKIITRLNYRRDHRGYNPSGFRHIFVVDATGGTPRQITTGDYNHGSPEWHPNGQSILFSGLRAEDADWQIRESEIYRVQLDGGEIEQLTDRPGSDSGPVVSPDGKKIAYRVGPKNKDTYNVTDIQIAEFVYGGLKAIKTIRLDRQPSSLTWAKNGDDLYATYRDSGENHLWRFSTDANPVKLTRGRIRFRLADIGKDGTIVGIRSAALEPGDIWTNDTATGWRRLTNVNADVLAGIELGAVEEIRYKSHGDLEIQGWIVKPPHFDKTKKYPLILQIHGGPHGMYGIDFSFERQNHAAEGYVVLYTNPRGSAGYGKKFGNEINNAYPGYDYDDLMRGVDAVIAKGYIDEKSLFVYGGSGGGVLTAWIVGHTDRFAAAVSMFPVINWISFVGTTDGPYWYTNFKQLPWEGIEEHWNRSPLKYVGNVTTPTMLITGELDLRTPMAQTEEFYQALKLRKIDTMMIRVPDEYHGAAGRHLSNRLRRILYVRKWFEKYGSNNKVVQASAKKDGR